MSRIIFLFVLTLAYGAPEYRLPKGIIPVSYSITISPLSSWDNIIRPDIFSGSVDMKIVANESLINEVTFHVKDIQIESISIKKDTILPIKSLKITGEQYFRDVEQYSIYLEKPLEEGSKYILKISYSAKMSQDNSGFYLSPYENVNQIEKWVGATQLQRIEARRVFPCFDEPQLKATFQVNIVRPKEYNSFSNTRLVSTTDEGQGWQKDIYEPTPVMSTYLVAFLVSDFVARYNEDQSYAVISRPEFYNKTEFSFDIGLRVLHAYEQLFDIEYKSMGNEIFQMASVPTFTHNGMENWGLILYKEPVLVYEEGYTSISGQQYMITILAHEICHMWFGNLVTFEWWGYFWLNEAFARYYQFYLAHELYPEYDLEKQFVVDQMHLIFNNDAKYGVAKLTDPTVASPSEIGSMFSSITYVKGASIVRQIRHAMGEDRFVESLRNYLSENAFKSTNPDHIFKHFKENWPSEQKVNLDEYFEDWFEKVGYPLVSVILSSDGKSMKINQERFLLNRHDGSVKDYYYTVPFTYTTSWKTSFTNTTPSFYLSNEPGQKQIIKLEQEAKWVVANIKQSGYYRVNYDRSTWLALKKALSQPDWSGIDEINRAQMVDDLFALGKTGYLTYDFVFNILEYLSTEIAYIPWKPSFIGLKFLETRLGMERRDDFEKFITTITKKVAYKLDFSENKNDKILDIYNRDKITNWACKYNNEDCLKNVNKQMSNFLLKDVKPSVNQRSSVYCSAMREPSEKDFNSFLSKYKSEPYGPEKEIIIESIGCVKVEKLVEKLFEILQTEQISRKDHKKSCLTALYTENQENVDLMFNLVTRDYNKLINVLGDSDTASILTGIADRFTTLEQKKQLETFIDQNLDLIATQETKLRKSLESVEENLEWSSQHLPSLITYFKQSQNGSPATTCGLILMSLSVLALYVLG